MAGPGVAQIWAQKWRSRKAGWGLPWAGLRQATSASSPSRGGCLGLGAADPSGFPCRSSLPAPLLPPAGRRLLPPGSRDSGTQPAAWPCVGPPGLLKAGIWPSWWARQAGIMGVTQPKRGLTSSAQRGGHNSGGPKPPLPEPAGQPSYLLSPLHRPPARDAWPRPPPRQDALPAGPAATLPPPPVAALPPGFQARGSPAGQACREPGAGKVTAGHCSLYLASAPPLPRAWGCSCLRPCSLRLQFRFPRASRGRGIMVSTS